MFKWVVRLGDFGIYNHIWMDDSNDTELGFMIKPRIILGYRSFAYDIYEKGILQDTYYNLHDAKHRVERTAM